MKKLKYLLLLSLIIIPINANALSVTCSSKGSVTVGNTITVTISANANDMPAGDTADILAGRVEAEGGLSLQGSSDFTKNDWRSFSKSYTFKALTAGTATVRAVGLNIVETGSRPTEFMTSGASTPCNITISNVSSQKANSTTNYKGGTKTNNNTNKTDTNQNTDVKKDDTNSLASLSVDGGILDPEFDKDTLEYNVEVDNSVEKTTINANATSDKSSIKGNGEVTLEEGQNAFEVVVTSESGNTRTYTINITRKEKNPIKVTIDGKTYSVVRGKSDLDVPSNFKETTIKINGDDVTAYKHNKLDITLVALTDGSDNYWFIYDSKTNTYTKYNEFTNDSLRLLLKDVSGKKDGFKIETISINGEDYKVFVSTMNNNFIVVYATNLNTGKDGYYLYDKLNNSVIAYDDNIYTPKMNIFDALGLYTALKGSKYLGIYAGIAALFILMLILCIVLSVKNRKLKKRIKLLSSTTNNEDNNFLEDTDDNIEDDTKEDTIKEVKIEEDNVKEEPTKEDTKVEETITKENGISELEEVSKLYNASLETNNNLEDGEIDDDFADLKPKKRKKKKHKK